MSFLDNLENNLKAFESREQNDPAERARAAASQAAEREAARRTAPHAEALRSSPFTAQLLTAARTIGHRQRTLVRFTWIDTLLRLEAGPRRLDLQPTADGIVAVFQEEGSDSRTEPVDLTASAEEFARRWLNGAAG